mmetsp:Transcript_17229/g.31002  ORF Transcript_17229/g.31002 Transcript_17229/m.31002 type:complete len:351 (+) Transcript_17229:5367-6419(+)
MEFVEYNGVPVIEGYLKKLKSKGATLRFLSKFVKRWFVLDLQALTFGYFKSMNRKKLLRSHSTKDIIRFDHNPRVLEASDWKFMLVIETRTKTYSLYADSASTHAQWCTGLQHAVQLNSSHMRRLSAPISKPVDSDSPQPQEAPRVGRRSNRRLTIDAKYETRMPLSSVIQVHAQPMKPAAHAVLPHYEGIEIKEESHDMYRTQTVISQHYMPLEVKHAEAPMSGSSHFHRETTSNTAHPSFPIQEPRTHSLNPTISSGPAEVRQSLQHEQHVGLQATIVNRPSPSASISFTDKSQTIQLKQRAKWGSQVIDPFAGAKAIEDSLPNQESPRTTKMVGNKLHTYDWESREG